MGRLAVAVLTAATLGLAVIAGCGSDDESGAPLEAAVLGEGGTLAMALAAAPEELDPLLASDRSSQLLTRQIHEPLVETVTGPFGDLRELPGLARAYRPSGDRTIWRFELRRRVHFQDGSLFNASAVLANAERWQASERGRELLPDLVAVDAPRPDLVRFVLSAPDPDFPSRLSVAELGLVSPGALRPEPERLGLRREDRSGTGPFELRSLTASGSLIVRNVSWWGARFELGPALDQIEFPVATDPAERFDLLSSGEAQVSDRLDRGSLQKLEEDPLLTFENPPGGPRVGLERSVRGLRFDLGLPLLSGVWLTAVGAAG